MAYTFIAQQTGRWMRTWAELPINVINCAGWQTSKN